ncbi:hypothetical protein SY89_01612 [Halolamina pelagica]|uniref:Uncharacterized protein n=1 Tax=Halolamina pelagica TaxID=699431 RepID=A0A0P7GZ75_9EURY|nr:hypothetical protein [Halolamina pelagica]KPN30872.1 hypothetical protein SY89_01612 [Halolamina pelagica]
MANTTSNTDGANGTTAEEKYYANRLLLITLLWLVLVLGAGVVMIYFL